MADGESGYARHSGLSWKSYIRRTWHDSSELGNCVDKLRFSSKVCNSFKLILVSF